MACHFSSSFQPLPDVLKGARFLILNGAYLSEVAPRAARFYVSITWRKAEKRDAERQSKPKAAKVLMPRQVGFGAARLRMSLKICYHRFNMYPGFTSAVLIRHFIERSVQ